MSKNYVKPLEFEEMEHVLRHVKVHKEEFDEGRLKKGKEYIDLLKSAQLSALEVTHDIVHIMRSKKFKGYENSDFEFDVILPKKLKDHEFKTYVAGDFELAKRTKSIFDMGILPENLIPLPPDEAVKQMKILESVTVDVGVFIELLEKEWK